MNQLYPWQRSIWSQIRNNAITKAQAFIFSGRKGIGQLEFSNYLAKSLLCEQPTQTQYACGNCRSCQWFEQGIHPNFYRLEPEAWVEFDADAAQTFNDSKQPSEETSSKKKLSQQITIDQTRHLDQFLYLSAHQSARKIILIHPADCMNIPAANAMLKKIEEPPPQVLFFLVTDRLQTLLPTIVSRCMRITLPHPDRLSVKDWLHQEGIDESSIDLSWFGTSPQLVKRYFEADYLTYHAELIAGISSPMQLDPIALAEKLYKLELSMIISWLQKWCYDLVSHQMIGMVYYHRRYETAIKTIVAKTEPKQLIDFWKQLTQFQQLSKHPLNTRLFLEELLLAYVKTCSRN